MSSNGWKQVISFVFSPTSNPASTVMHWTARSVVGSSTVTPGTGAACSAVRLMTA
ncbi:hypothetical protein [Streptomyces sp. NPDC005953]|uniref:hypothetical protein n=1 Tax=Streptomyces sp. NPDC005953 TaxID=3156719 RepID=UPI0033D96EDC